jgi:hypothetical protein
MVMIQVLAKKGIRCAIYHLRLLPFRGPASHDAFALEGFLATSLMPVHSRIGCGETGYKIPPKIILMPLRRK